MYKRFLFCLVIAATFSLFSCSRNSGIKAAVSGDEQAVSWWCSNRASSFDIDMEELPVFIELQQKSGTAIDFIHPPASQYSLRFDMMLASGRLPDIISHDFINDYPGGITGAIEDGVIIPIDEKLLEHAPNLSSYLDGNPEIAGALRLPDGDFFCVPSLCTDAGASTYMGPFIRQDLLSKHELEIPVTIDEWEKVLEIFHNDPDIDIPLTFYGGNFKATRFLIGSFNTAWGFYQEEGRLVYGPAEARFRDFILLFRDWYGRGWIDPGVLINSRRAYEKTVRSRSVGIYIDYISNILNYRRMLKKRNPSAELMPLSNPSLYEGLPAPRGHRAGFFLPFASAYISSEAENPEKILSMLDFAWSEEGRILFNYGIEGESYLMIDGKPVINKAVFDSDGTGSLKYYLVSGPYLKDPDSFMQSLPLEKQKHAAELWRGEAPGFKSMQPLIPVNDDEIRLNEICAVLDSYILEAVTDIITGKKSAGAIDELQSELGALGLDEAIEIFSAAAQ